MIYNTLRALQLTAYLAVELTYVVSAGYNHLVAHPQQAADRCRAKEFKCEARCNEDTKGGTMARLRCYDRCREDEQDCRKYGEDGP